MSGEAKSTGNAWPGSTVRSAWPRRIRRAAALLTALFALVVAASLIWVRVASAGRVYPVADVPERPVALVLGAQVNADGRPSAFLAARLALALDLYRHGKVRAILVSGDNMNFGYNEPDAMRMWLIDRGIPASKVVADYAGFDTSDSCQRAGRIFGATALIVVTQSFHVGRAVALCRHAGIDAIGVGDDSVAVYRRPWLRATLREQGAIVKALFDVATGQEPTHWGPRETSLDDALGRGAGPR